MHDGNGDRADYNFPIDSKAPVSLFFRARGIEDFAAACLFIRQLPYARNSVKDDPAIVLREGRGTCGTKHAVLKQLAIENGLSTVRLMTGMYRMNKINTPGVGDVLDRAGLDYLPEAHNYLRIDGHILDCTTAQTTGAFARDLLEETEIEPEQIGAWKVAYHRQFLAGWIPGKFGGTPEDAWEIREACIAAMSGGTDKRV